MQTKESIHTRPKHLQKNLVAWKGPKDLEEGWHKVVRSISPQIGIPNSKQNFQYILSSFSNFMS